MSNHPATFTRLARLALLVSPLALAAPGCSSDAGTSTDDVTDIKNTAVKNQSIGNCWIYATVGWAESLHLTHAGATLDLSESWISYWHWYEEIAGPPPGLPLIARLDKEQLSTGGWYGLAGELMRRYGVIAEGKFIPEEAEAARSSRQSQALSAINTSLKSGALKDPAARKDRKLVRAELDRAWGLSPEVSANLDSVYGADVTRTLLSSGVSVPNASGIQFTREIPVAHDVSLADAIGEPSSSYDVLRRKGKFAWNEVSYPSLPSGRRSLLARMQKAMHDGMPVIMTWYVDFAALSGSAFKAPPATPGRQGGHMTVVEDYQVSGVPGYGTLAAGVPVTDPTILEAALDPRATIDFIRIKNSWGLGLAPEGANEALRGYYDLYAAYLDGPLTKCTEANGEACGVKSQVPGLTSFVLPSDAFVAQTKVTKDSCGDICEPGAARPPACDPCSDLICTEDSYCCESEWDQACVEKAIEICELTCK